MNQEVKIHNVWAEWERLKEKNPQILKPIIGKHQYIFSGINGKISCVELKDYFMDGQDLWEIYCLEGNLFEDIERFNTLEDARERCRLLLDAKDKRKRRRET